MQHIFPENTIFEISNQTQRMACGTLQDTEQRPLLWKVQNTQKAVTRHKTKRKPLLRKIRCKIFWQRIPCPDQSHVTQCRDQNLSWNGDVFFHILDERAISEDLWLNLLVVVWPGWKYTKRHCNVIIGRGGDKFGVAETVEVVEVHK